MKTAAARTIVVTAALLLCILPLEGLSRWWVSRYGDALDRSMAVLRMDSRLGWRQRERFRGRFMNIPVETDSRGLRNPFDSANPPGGRLVLLLGPSSTFGWGVREDLTYARRLEALLRRTHPKESITVINAGEIGFSSWQGLEFYRGELRSVKPDLIIAAYGANDVDRFRFFSAGPLPDASALGPGLPPLRIAVRNILGRLRMATVASRQAAKLRARLSCVLDGKEGPAPAVQGVRVPKTDFTANFARFRDIAREDGAKIIFLTTAFHYPETEEASAADRIKSSSLLSQGLRALKDRRYRLAERTLRSSIAADPSRVEALYALGACLASERNCRRSREAFQQARRREPFRVGRDLAEYNQALRELSAREKVPLLDARALLESGDIDGLFADPIHPSAEGHGRIAAALFDLIEKNGLLPHNPP